jgi:hypothetical protein
MAIRIMFDELEGIEREMREANRNLKAINATLQLIARLLDHHPVHLSIIYTDPNTGSIISHKGEHEVQITDIQSVRASLGETDAAGNPVPLDPSIPAPVWAVADPAILSMTDNGDGSVTFKAVGPLGSSQVSVNYAGLSAQDQIDVVNSAATALSIKFDTPA